MIMMVKSKFFSANNISKLGHYVGAILCLGEARKRDSSESNGTSNQQDSGYCRNYKGLLSPKSISFYLTQTHITMRN